MTASPLFSFRQQSYDDASPIAPGTVSQTVNQYKDWLAGVVSGSAPVGVSNKPFIVATYDEAQATGSLLDNGLTGGDVAGAAINGVAATATYATSVNNTLTLIKNKINAGGNTPNALIYKAVFAKREFTSAAGTFTVASLAAGATSVEVAGATVTFTAVGDDAIDAAALALAINTTAGCGAKVFASSDGVDTVTVTASGANRATLGLSSAAGTVGCRVSGNLVAVTYATSDAATTTALAAAINADPVVRQIVRAVVTASTTITLVSVVAGDQMAAVGATGTGVTVGGVATPSTTLTISSASGTLTAYVNGVPVASVTAVGTNATDAAALAAAINASTFARAYVVATVSAAVVTVTSLAGVPLQAVGTGVTASAAYLTDAGTYGGVAGNALTLVGTTGITASGSGTLEEGLSSVSIIATRGGVSGNWITLATSGAGAAHVDVNGPALTGGAETTAVLGSF